MPDRRANEMKQGPLKTEISILWGIVTALALYFGWKALDIVGLVRDKYPMLGLFGWSLIVLWIGIGIASGILVTSYCKKKKLARACYLEGWSASALYFFISLVIYLVLIGKP
jgi:hypothetical protein